MITHIPMDIAPIRMASAVFFSSTISLHKWYGVNLSMNKNAATKMRMPKNEYNKAFPRFARKGCISFSSKVVGIRGVDAPIGAGIVPNRLGNVLDLVDPLQTPAVVLRSAQEAEYHQAVCQEKSVHEVLLS
jgi:hypothetical protein